MPFCTQCGKQVGANDTFCANCGAKQGGGGASAGPAGYKSAGFNGREFGADVNPRTFAALCYLPVMGWISSLYVLASARFRNDQMVRFHAFQGLFLFVVWLLLDWVVAPILGGGMRLRWVAGTLKGGLSLLGIIMLIKTLKNQDERLPFLGDLAERSMREQR